MISILCPTRNRLEALKTSLESLRAHAHSRANYEVLLAIDDDDQTDYSEVGDLIITLPTGGPEHNFAFRYGYKNLHIYYYELAMVAKGDWLFLWNDDAIMQTFDWDKTILSFPTNLILSPYSNAPLYPSDQNGRKKGTQCCIFPIVPKRFVDAIGHFSLNAHNDTWWEEIAYMLGILTWIPIYIFHDRASETGNNNDATYQERQYDTGAFWSNLMQQKRSKDAETIKAIL